MTDPVERGHEEIERIGAELDIDGDIIDIAHAIFVRADDEGLLSGRAAEMTAGAAVLIACRQNGLPFGARDIAAATTHSPSEDDSEAPSPVTRFERTRRKIESALQIDTGVVRPDAYIDRYIAELELSSQAETVARDVLSRAVQADRESFSGKSPSGVAGAAIYLATLLCNERRTQSRIAEVAASEVAIRSNYHALLRLFGERDIRFDDPNLNTDRFDHEVDKVMSGNESPSEAEQDGETGSDESASLTESTPSA